MLNIHTSAIKKKQIFPLRNPKQLQIVVLVCNGKACSCKQTNIGPPHLLN